MSEEIDVDYNDTLNLTEPPGFLSGIEANYENIEQNCGLDLKDNNEPGNPEEIPAVTIKQQKNTDDCKFKDKKQSDQKILPMNIIDILSSKIISQNPYCYVFMGTDYKYTLIFGTVTGIKYRKENKINIEVDDGTGCINCIINKSETELQCRKEISDLSNICNNQDLLDKKEVIRLANEDEEMDEDVANKFLASASNMFLKKMTKQLEQLPTIQNLKIGDKVSIVGNVSDFQDQRLIFAKHIRREVDDNAYLNHMLTITQRKQQ